MSFRASALVGLFVASALVACGEPEDGAASADSEVRSPDSLLDMAPKLELGKAASGSIAGSQVDVWALDLKQGDEITITQTVTKGDLAPDFGLFTGGSGRVSSETNTPRTATLTKTYTIDWSGLHSVGVAAFEGKGAGDYTIEATCTGGPCAGEPFVAPLEQHEINACIRKARECAIDGGKPWDECLKTVSLSNGRSCAVACDGEEAKWTCDEIANKVVPFFAAKPDACKQVLRSCMSDCGDAGYDLRSTQSEEMCLVNGFNGTCDGYARDSVACGGSMVSGSKEECYALCETTRGAWVDDLDTMCSDECGHME